MRHLLAALEILGATAAELGTPTPGQLVTWGGLVVRHPLLLYRTGRAFLESFRARAPADPLQWSIPEVYAGIMDDLRRSPLAPAIGRTLGWPSDEEAGAFARQLQQQLDALREQVQAEERERDELEDLRGLVEQLLLKGGGGHRGAAHRLAELDREAGRPRRCVECLLSIFGFAGPDCPAGVRAHAGGELSTAYDAAYGAPLQPGEN